jgi:hypothetical protein
MSSAMPSSTFASTCGGAGTEGSAVLAGDDFNCAVLTWQQKTHHWLAHCAKGLTEGGKRSDLSYVLQQAGSTAHLLLRGKDIWIEQIKFPDGR